MKSLLLFFRNFFQNQGQHIFVSMLVAKVCAFLSSLVVIHLLPKEDFGKMSLVAAVFTIFSSASGLGNYQSLLRFGSMVASQEEKDALSVSLFRQGFVYQLLLSILFMGTSLFYIQKFQDIVLVFVFFTIRFIGFYFFNHIQTYLRITGRNKDFAHVNNVVNVGGLLLTLLLTYFFQLYGFLFAVAFAPFLVFFFLQKNMILGSGETTFNQKEIWNYAYHTAGTLILSEAFFAADVFIIGFLLGEIAVANYKVALLIPSNFAFLALVFIQTSFPEIAKNHKNKMYLERYIQNYFKIFIPVVIGIFTIGFLFSKEILAFFFSAKYENNIVAFRILLFAFLMNLLFRNLFGNLLSAVGKMKINTVVSFLSLIFMMIFGYILTKIYGVSGMAFSLSFVLLTSGFVFAASFYKYLKTIK